MNKYIFPGADASCSLGWVINQVEAAGFEVKNIDVLGVHYSATIWRWYQNWLFNKDKVIAKYGERWVFASILREKCLFPMFPYLAGIGYGFSSWRTLLSLPGLLSIRVTFGIIDENSKPSRQGGASLFQITLHKNLNAYHRIEGVPSHSSIHISSNNPLS